MLSAVKKADKDYTENCYKAETARQDWDFTVAKVGACLPCSWLDALQNSLEPVAV